MDEQDPILFFVNKDMENNPYTEYHNRCVMNVNIGMNEPSFLANAYLDNMEANALKSEFIDLVDYYGDVF